MDKGEIIEQIKLMETAEDLASLLDRIKQDEFGSVRYSITEKMGTRAKVRVPKMCYFIKEFVERQQNNER